MFNPLFAGAQIEEHEQALNISNAADSLSRTKLNLLTKAKKLSFTGKQDSARRVYSEILKLDSLCDVCYYELANLYIRNEEYGEAQKNAERAYALDSVNSWFTLLYARLCFQHHQYERAQRLFRQILRAHGDKQEVWLNLASSYEEQGLEVETAGILDSMLMRFGETDDIVYRLFNLYANTGNNEKALESAKKLSEHYPDDERFTTMLADTYAITGKDSLAVEAYDRAIGENNVFPPAYLGKAEMFRKKGKFVEYFKCVQKYTANRQIDAKSKVDYLELILKIPAFADHFQQDIDTLFAIMTSVHPTSVELKFTQAYYFVHTRRPEIAVSLFNQIVNIDEENKEAWTGLLAIEFNLSMYAQLEQSARKAIASDPKYANFYMYLFLALLNQNKAKLAIETLETGVKRANCDSTFISNAYTGLGDAYYNINKPKKAFKYYEKALAVDPDNALVLNNYAYYLSLMKKNIDKAFEMSKKAIEIEESNPSFLDTYAYILYIQGKYAEAKTFFRKAIARGGGDNAVVLDHYADTLYKLGDKDAAEIYWSQALSKPDCPNPDDIKKKLKK
jgi:tetratricopeptide (TPR) repeat protein